MGYVFLTIALLLNATANILLKLASEGLNELKGLGLMEMLPRLLTNYRLIVGLSFFALNVIFYIVALNRLKLSVAYPIMMAGGIVIITVFSALYLKEALNLLQYGGIALIAGGIILVTSQAS